VLPAQQGLQIGGLAVSTSVSGGGVEAGGGASGIRCMGRIGNAVEKQG